jgi:hypothetical protein
LTVQYRLHMLIVLADAKYGALSEVMDGADCS